MHEPGTHESFLDQVGVLETSLELSGTSYSMWEIYQAENGADEYFLQWHRALWDNRMEAIKKEIATLKEVPYGG